MKKLYVAADTNDADYVYRMSDITDEEIEKFKPIIEAVKKTTPRHNWPDNEWDNEIYVDLYPEFDEDLLVEFRERFVPYWEYGIHTIKFIEVLEIDTITRLL